MRKPCRIVTLSDGTQVRVQGAVPDLDVLESLRAAVRERWERECHALSDVPMPTVAQRIHGRDTYWCGRERGHDGAHRWPADTGRLAEWSDA